MTRPDKKWFALPVGMYLLLALLYMWAVPTGESPDEPGHLRCLEQVAVESHLPLVAQPIDESKEWWARENIISDYMCYHMPLYYAGGGLTLRLFAAVSGTAAAYELPPSNPDYGDTPNMFEPLPDDPAQPFTLIGLRFISILLGLMMLWATAVIATRVFPGAAWVPLLAVTLVAGWPQFIFLSRAITNDSLATALALIVLVLLTDVGKPQRFIWAALVAALAFLTKLSVAFTVGLVLAAWGVEFLFLAEERPRYLRPLLSMTAVYFGLGLLTRLQPMIWHNWTVSMADFAGANISVFDPAYWQQIYVWTLSSGWAWFGWLSLMPPAWHAQVWWLILQSGSLLGIYVVSTRPLPPNQRLLWLILALWWLAVAFSYIRVTSNRWQPQFRFAFAMIPLLTTFTAGSTLLLPLREGRRPWLLILPVASLLFVYNLWLIFAIVLPAYA